MKTQVIFRTMLLFMMLFIANVTMIANGNDPENNFIRNVEEVDGMVVTETIFKMESGMLSNYMRHCYKYDANKQRIEDQAQKWNAVNESWDNDMCIRYTHNDNSITTEYYKWDKKKKDYIIVPGMTVTMSK